MKKNKRKSFLIKIFLFVVVLALIIFAMNNYVLPWFVSSPEEIVPKLVGMTQKEALAELEKINLQPVIADTIYNEKYDLGVVILQKPRPGQVVKDGRRIYIFISGGKQTVKVPNLKGKSLREAKFMLERLGLKMGDIEDSPSNNPKDMIFDQQYAEGTPLKRGDSVGVTLTIGTLSSRVILPDFIGKSLSEVVEILADSSLRVGTVTFRISNSLLPNTVIDQFPSQGSVVSVGSQVDLFVTKNPDNEEEQ
ncbi:MAG TPA: PASTA domain-containing protein [Ignavibacteria bacterium]|nr:PASTA domain-containing protein [Ignavibacteria bacterium]